MTLGLGAVIGAIVTLPILGPALVDPFVDQETDDIDIGALDDFPENRFVITTFLLDPAQGEVSRRTAYVRNNGPLNGDPTFTILSNRCVHLGCPVQVNGLPLDDAAQTERINNTAVRRIPTAAAVGFGCPCHGGQYDSEGNRTAGHPARARPLRVQDQERTARPEQDLQRLVRRGHGRGGGDPQVRPDGPGPARRRARGSPLSDPAAG